MWCDAYTFYTYLLFTAYSGTAPGDHVIGYSVFVIGLAGSESVQYFLSAFISAEANLFVILIVTILAVPLFTIADIHYGSGTSRNICGKKKVAVVENGNIQSETAVTSSKESGECHMRCVVVFSKVEHKSLHLVLFNPLVCHALYALMH